MRGGWTVAAVAAVSLLCLGALGQDAGGSGHREEFAVAGKAFGAGDYPAALVDFKKLIAEEPENAVYKKFASEAALNVGDAGFVLQTLPPVEAADSKDWQARLLLARAYAQTADEPGHKEARDGEIAAVRKLHGEDANSALGKLRDFKLETVREGSTTVEFYPAFAPWGPYHVHLIARTYDAAKQPGLRITLESGDGDQGLFAKQHPAESAAGLRSFSLDGYGPDQTGPNGEHIQTHYTFAFFVGEPSYDAVRERVLAVVSGKLKALSSRSGPVN